MSLRTLPLLFINLGGEMLYILDQRLRAQNIPPDKAKKDLGLYDEAVKIIHDFPQYYPFGQKGSE